jgi:hypothetical protein
MFWAAREGAFALLRDAILPALVGRSFGSLAEVMAFLEKCDGKAPADGRGRMNHAARTQGQAVSSRPIPRASSHTDQPM